MDAHTLIDDMTKDGMEATSKISEKSEPLKTKSTEKSIPLKNTCTICNKVLSCTFSFNRHMRTHSKNKSLNKTRGKTNEIRENKNKMNRKKTSCKVCNKVYSNTSNYNRHMRTHQTNTNLNRTRAKTKEIKENQNKIDEKATSVSTKHVCKHCSKCYSTQNGLRKHIKKHKENQPNNNDDLQPTNKQNPNKTQAITKEIQENQNKIFEKATSVSTKHVCKHCSKCYSTQNGLRKHIKKHKENQPNNNDDLQPTNKQNPNKTQAITKEIQENQNKIFEKATSVSTKHVCKHCSKCYSTQNGLRKHIKKHKETPPNNNDDPQPVNKQKGCKSSSDSKTSDSSSKIISDTSTSDTSFKIICKICGKGYSCQSNLNKHLRKNHSVSGSQDTENKQDDTVTGQKESEDEKTESGKEEIGAKSLSDSKPSDSSSKIICKICGKGYSCHSNLNKHLRRNHSFTGSKDTANKQDDTVTRVTVQKESVDEKSESGPEKIAVRFIDKIKHKCTVCSKQFRLRSSFIVHMNKHRGKRYTCEICAKSYTASYSLVIHRRTHTGHLPYSCSKCHAKFKQRSHCVRHEQTHEKTHLVRDFKWSSPIRTPNQRVEDSSKIYACTLCNKTFKTKDSFKVHKYKHLGKRYSCDMCEKSFTASYTLKVHKLSIHEKQKPWICSTCGVRYALRKGLVRHLKVHRGEKNVICDQCGKCFVDGDALSGHKKTHLTMAPFKCHLCDASLKTNHTLQIHLKTHLNPAARDFQCDICQRKFTQKHSLITHKKLHQKGEVTKIAFFKAPTEFCEICGKGFVNKLGLTRHLRKHEKGQLRNTRPVFLNCQSTAMLQINETVMHNESDSEINLRNKNNSYASIVPTLNIGDTSVNINIHFIEHKVTDKEHNWVRKMSMSQNVVSEGDCFGDKKITKTIKNQVEVVNEAEWPNLESDEIEDLSEPIQESKPEKEDDEIVKKEREDVEHSEVIIDDAEPKLIVDENVIETMCQDALNVNRGIISPEVSLQEEIVQNECTEEKEEQIVAENTEDTEEQTVPGKQIVAVEQTVAEEQIVTEEQIVVEEQIVEVQHTEHENESTKMEVQDIYLDTYNKDSDLMHDYYSSNETDKTKELVDKIIKDLGNDDNLEAPIHNEEEFDDNVDMDDVESLDGGNHIENDGETNDKEQLDYNADTDVENDYYEDENIIITSEKTVSLINKLNIEKENLNQLKTESDQETLNEDVESGNKTLNGQQEEKSNDAKEQPHLVKPKCIKCKKIFKDVTNMRKHISKFHKNLKKFHCEYKSCNRWFVLKRELLEHSLIHKMVRVCKICSFEVSRASNLDRHMKRRHGTSFVLKIGEDYKCKLCNAVFNTQEQCLTHVNEHERNEQDDTSKDASEQPQSVKPRCSECKKIFKDVTNMRKHISKFHKNLKKFQCEYKGCNRWFVLKCELTEHSQIHYKVRVCKICSFEVSSASNLDRHMKRRHGTTFVLKIGEDYVCKLCNTLFCTQEQCLSHVNAHEEVTIVKQRRNIIEKETVNKNYLCNVCGKSFKHKNSLQKHEQSHSIDDNDDFDGTLNQQGKSLCAKNSHACSICPKTFVTKGGLLRHKAGHVNGMLEFCPARKHMCSLCGKTYTAAASLSVHMTTHTNDRPFRCLCGKTYRQSGHLSRHKKMSHTVYHKVFECEFSGCGKKFTRQESLKAHMLRHTAVKTWMCDICPKVFVTKAILVTHRKKHFGITEFVCKLCGQRLTTKLTLRQHMLRHEKLDKMNPASVNYDPQYKGKVKPINPMVKKTVNCSNCNVMFTTKRALVCHKKNVCKGSTTSSLNELRIIDL